MRAEEPAEMESDDLSSIAALSASMACVNRDMGPVRYSFQTRDGPYARTELSRCSDRVAYS